MTRIHVGSFDLDHQTDREPFTDAETFAKRIAENEEKLSGHSLPEAERWRIETDLKGLRETRDRVAGWIVQYGRRVPENWVFVQGGMAWHNITAALRDPNTELSAGMVDAAVHYPDWNIQLQVAERAALTPLQLDYLRQTINIQNILDEIIDSQNKLRDQQAAE